MIWGLGEAQISEMYHVNLKWNYSQNLKLHKGSAVISFFSFSI